MAFEYTRVDSGRVSSIQQLEDYDFRNGKDFKSVLPSKELGVGYLSYIAQRLRLTYSRYDYMLLEYNRTAMFVHAFNLLTQTIDVVHYRHRMYIVQEA